MRSGETLVKLWTFLAFLDTLEPLFPWFISGFKSWSFLGLTKSVGMRDSASVWGRHAIPGCVLFLSLIRTPNCIFPIKSLLSQVKLICRPQEESCQQVSSSLTNKSVNRYYAACKTTDRNQQRRYQFRTDSYLKPSSIETEMFLYGQVW